MLFTSLTKEKMVEMIWNARSRVCYVGPGILEEVAQSIAKLSDTDVNNELSLVVAIDHSDFTIRSGFGKVDGVNVLRNAEVPVLYAQNYRLGILIVDDEGYAFAPPPLCIEAEAEALINAMSLSVEQINEVVIRFSHKEAQKAADACDSEEERRVILEKNAEIQLRDITNEQIDKVNEEIEKNPPVDFDIMRQMNVFSSALQYVEIEFTGSCLQRKKVPIPKEILDIGLSEDVKKSYQATFKLLDERNMDVSVTFDSFKEKYESIKNKYLTSMGHLHGLVIRKTDKNEFEEEIENLKLETKKEAKMLEGQIDHEIECTKEKLIQYFLPIVLKTPPNEVCRRINEVNDLFCVVTEDVKKGIVEKWVKEVFDRNFPKAKDLFSKMNIDYKYKDLTYATLKDEEFLTKVAESPELSDLLSSMGGEKLVNEYSAAPERSRWY